jgi:hypothetical protein
MNVQGGQSCQLAMRTSLTPGTPPRNTHHAQIKDFDGMLKWCVQLAGGLDLPALLRLAALLASHVGSAAEEVLAPLRVAWGCTRN